MISFYKYQGTGNDFVIIDDRDGSFDHEDNELISKLCDRKFGVGADGLMLLRNDDQYDFRMVYFNADGYEGSMCGNGGRALVRFAHDLGLIGDETTFIAVDGEHEAKVFPDLVSLKMNDVNNIEHNLDFDFMDTGSPHYVAFVDDVENYDVVGQGKAVRYNERFSAEGTNVNFVQKSGADSLTARTYERGVEDETLSCGTGVTACALSAALQGFQSPISVKTLGGDLSISFDRQESRFTNVFLNGPAVKVFSGQIEVQ